MYKLFVFYFILYSLFFLILYYLHDYPGLYMTIYRCCFGSVSVYGSIAYTSQVAFIQNSTLKENIIYGNPYDEERYQQTLRVCALLQDIQVLPAGHETEIGERGINLSGGMIFSYYYGCFL